MTTTNPILIAAAVIPAVYLLVQVYKADKLEKEPPRLIFLLVLQGIFATLLAMLTESIGQVILEILMPEDSLLYYLVFTFLVVGLSEEGFKYLLPKNRTWNSPHFNCQFDGVVYAVAVSLGFALWENIGYVGMYGLGTAMVRAITAVPGHACFGVFMGAFYGMSKRQQLLNKQAPMKLGLKLTLWVPVVLHGCYDFIAMTGLSDLIFIVFVGGMFFTASRMVKNLSRHDRYL